MSTAVTVGNFQETEQLQDGHLLARLTLPAQDLQLDWRRFSLVANYLAEYSAYHFEQKDRAENLISSVFYELIERLASSSRREARLDIRFSAFAGSLDDPACPPELSALLRELLPFEVRVQRSGIGRKLIDGKGASRVAAELFGEESDTRT